MSTLTDFEQSHNHLSSVIEHIKEVGFRSEAAKQILMESKPFILSHLLKSNRDYYPLLQIQAESIPQLNRIFNIFTTDMKLTAKTIQEFYLHYHQNGSGLAYAGECGRVYALLTHCAHKENTMLSMLKRFSGGQSSTYTPAPMHQTAS